MSQRKNSAKKAEFLKYFLNLKGVFQLREKYIYTNTDRSVLKGGSYADKKR